MGINNIKHIGIYVKNLKKQTLFYKNVFDMVVVCENVVQKDAIVEDIFHDNHTELSITKLITEQGKKTGVGDMIELISVNGSDILEDNHSKHIYVWGGVHIGFGIHNMEDVVNEIVKFGGKQITKIHLLNNNKCCFCIDPEGNYLELIENL